MILGRVSKGKGGDLMLDTARKVLTEEFPELPSPVEGLESAYWCFRRNVICHGPLPRAARAHWPVDA